MADTIIKNTTFDCTISADIPNGVPTSDGDVRQLNDTLNALHAAAPLKKFDLERDSVDPELYSYEFEAADGRKWKQGLRFSGGTVMMSFTTQGDEWEESEFVLHRPVRAVCISLVNNFQVSKIRCRW